MPVRQCTTLFSMESARTTRLRRPLRRSPSCTATRVHRIPHPTFVTIAIRPSYGAGRPESLKVFLANGEAKYFCGKGWTGFQLICPTRLGKNWGYPGSGPYAAAGGWRDVQIAFRAIWMRFRMAVVGHGKAFAMQAMKRSKPRILSTRVKL